MHYIEQEIQIIQLPRTTLRQDFRTAPYFIMHTVLCLKKTIGPVVNIGKGPVIEAVLDVVGALFELNDEYIYTCKMHELQNANFVFLEDDNNV